MAATIPGICGARPCPGRPGIETGDKALIAEYRERCVSDMGRGDSPEGGRAREAAGELGRSSGSTVSKQLGKLEGKLMTDRNIQRRVKEAEEQLDEKRN